jgi:hypothetical protein
MIFTAGAVGGIRGALHEDSLAFLFWLLVTFKWLIHVETLSDP